MANKLKKKWRTFEDAEQVVSNINLNFKKAQINITFDVLVEGTVVNRDEKVLNTSNIIPENFIGEEKTEELITNGLAENHDKIVELAKKRMPEAKYTKKELNKEIKVCKKLAKLNLYHDLKVKTMQDILKIIVNNKGLDNILKSL